MKLTFVVLVLFTLLSVPFLESAPKSRIASVIIYRERAFISKIVTANVNKGENVIKLEGLTPDLIEQSVQVEILKGDGVKIVDVRVVETYLEKPETEKINRLKAKIDSLSNLISSKQSDIEVIDGQIEFLKKLSPSQKFVVAEFENLFKFYSKVLGESIAKMKKLIKEVEKLELEKKALEDEINNISSLKNTGKSIEVRTLSESKKVVELRVSYLVFGASWSPGYEIRANSGSNMVEFNFFAFARQSTGEDWVDVPVEISTAPVFISGTLPEISPWNIEVYQPRPILKRQLETPKLERETTLEALKPETEFIVPEVESDITSVNFKLQKLSIPSDAQPHKIFLSSFSQEVPFTYYAVPKLSRYAYLVVRLKNEFDFPILPGEARIFVDGNYVSTSSLKKISPDETFDLSFGIDENIKVERRLKRKFSEYTGVLGRNKKVSYEYEITIENGKPYEVKLEVKDNFPISRDERIKVVREAPSDKEADIGADGIITWKFSMKPREKRILTVKFYIEHPKDITVIGLE